MLRIGDKNVLFGGEKKIINFTISIGSTGEECYYSAEEGMTWQEFALSTYNDGKISINTNLEVVYMGRRKNYILYYNSNIVHADDIIICDAVYNDAAY